MEPEGSLLHSHSPNHDFLCQHFVTRNVFYGEELFAPRQTPKLEYHPLSAVCVCLFNIFAGTLPIGGRSSIHNLRTRHAVVTGTHSSWSVVDHCLILYIWSLTKRWRPCSCSCGWPSCISFSFFTAIIFMASKRVSVHLFLFSSSSVNTMPQ